MKSRRAASLLLIALGMAAAYASLTFLNTTWWRVNASLPPVLKDFNSSLYPLARGWYVLSDVNTTYYYMKFMPGWPEQYVVGQFQARDPGWQARLVAVGRSGSGTYAISLGGQVQITATQDAGPFVPTTAPLVWTMTATSRYSVLARAIFQQGGITAWQFVNFTAEPMTRLRTHTFTCGQTTKSEPFNYCTCYGTDGSLSFGWENAYAPSGVSYTTTGQGRWNVTLDSQTKYSGTYSLRLGADGTSTIRFGVAALIWDVSQLGITTDAAIQVYNRLVFSDNTVDEVNYVEFLVELPNGTRVKLYYARYIEDWKKNPFLARGTAIYDVIGGLSYVLNLRNFPNDGQSTWVYVGGMWHYVKNLGAAGRTYFTTFFPSGFNLATDSGVRGRVLSIAFVVSDGQNGDGAATSWWDDFSIQWRRICTCSMPSYISVSGSVSLDPYDSPTSPPSLSLSGDSRAVYTKGDWFPHPLEGSQYSLWSKASGSGAAAFHVAVDLDGDGVADREYIYYRYSATGVVLKSAVVSPGAAVCTIGTGGACTPADPRFVVISLGTLSGTQQWSVTTSGPGAVVALAMSTSGGATAKYDDLTATYSACGLPAGWGASGKYAWQSYNYLLVTGTATAYTQLVSGGLTYISNFTGSGLYAVFDSSLSPIFGVYKSGSSFSALCGFSTPLGVFPAAAV
ncbi:MAG: hypothetical protein ABWU84_10335, partial [Pyrobaculum sp.]|uniref:hypothetical protein n=1 Tax=Pyrobaculum sp. TaxID=2004705 RepID=UPI003EF016FD